MSSTSIIYGFGNARFVKDDTCCNWSQVLAYTKRIAFLYLSVCLSVCPPFHLYVCLPASACLRPYTSTYLPSYYDYVVSREIRLANDQLQTCQLTIFKISLPFHMHIQLMKMFTPLELRQ